MIYVFARTFDEGVDFIEVEGLDKDETKLYGGDPPYIEGLRFIPGVDRVFILRGMDQRLLNVVRRSAALTKFDLSASEVD